MRVVPAKNGWFWLLKGFALFRKSPVMWLFLVFTYWIAVALLGQIRYLGLATSTVLLPAFSVSFMAMCAVLERGGMLRPALLFSGFQSGLATLIALGVLYLLSVVAVLGIASLADAGALLQWVFYGQEPPQEGLRDGSVSRAFVVYGAALALAGLAFITAVTAAAIATSGQVEVLRFLGLIFTMLTLPTLFASFYASYRDIFPQDPVPADPPSNATGP